MLKEVDDVIKFRPRDLLNRFLSYVADASRSVKGTQRPLLILMFGHGTNRSSSITIGGVRRFEHWTLLTRQKSRDALLRGNPNANAKLLTTSCYGRGWVQDPNLDITAMAGVNHEEELLSWPTISSSGRACGSKYALGVARALMKKEIESVDIENEGMEILGSPTCAMLVSVIHVTLVKEVDKRVGQSISFSAEDKWGMKCRARTGFPLASHQEKWEALRRVKKSAEIGMVHFATVKFSDTVRQSLDSTGWISTQTPGLRLSE